MLGYLHLGNAFIAVNDDVNALAVCQSIRPMKDGVAVLASDPEEPDAEDAAEPEKTGDEREESETKDKTTDAEIDSDGDEDEDEDGDIDDDEAWSCDGICMRSFEDFDNAIICRMGCAYFCQSCYALFLEDKIPFRVCSRAHKHLKVPVLETRFKEGELVVGGKVVTLDGWKKSIKMSWGL